MLKNKVEIPNYENYIESVSKRLKNNYYTALKYEIEAFYDDEVEVDNPSYFRVDYELENEIIECFFEFQTFKTLELSVSLNSDNYSLEKFKMYLKKSLFNRKRRTDFDWDKCIWIYDSESQAYSTKLYKEIHNMENLLREFTYDVLNKNLGSTWFEDIAPYTVVKTAMDRKGSYKQIAPSFSDVDDSLMSVSTGDLYEIMTAEVIEWEPSADHEISAILSGRQPNIQDKLYNLLMEQTKVKIDIWNQYFADLLPDTFEDNFKKFESNRNHIAHNKHLDQKSFLSISQSIDDLKQDIMQAYEIFYSTHKSKEYAEYISKKEILLREIQEEIELEFMQSDSGVRIDDEETILEEMEYRIFELIEDFKDTISDRNDLVFSEITGLIINQTTSICDITSKIDGSKIEIFGYPLIDSSPGGESQIRLELSGQEDFHCSPISFQNGSCYFDEEQSTYLPELESKWNVNDFDIVLTELLNYFDNNIFNYKYYVDEKKIELGDVSTFISNIECEYCGEKYIYIDNTLADYGVCLCCGEMGEFE